mmetsp:Transcript_36946/g.116217  ORF Transcript_36946/g.116217 Transcript_36946/m.116217 type:complete len:452 (-) Transcript_36946:929-2284(-)
MHAHPAAGDAAPQEVVARHLGVPAVRELDVREAGHVLVRGLHQQRVPRGEVRVHEHARAQHGAVLRRESPGEGRGGGVHPTADVDPRERDEVLRAGGELAAGAEVRVVARALCRAALADILARVVDVAAHEPRVARPAAGAVVGAQHVAAVVVRVALEALAPGGEQGHVASPIAIAVVDAPLGVREEALLGKLEDIRQVPAGLLSELLAHRLRRLAGVEGEGPLHGHDADGGPRGAGRGRPGVGVVDVEERRDVPPQPHAKERGRGLPHGLVLPGQHRELLPAVLVRREPHLQAPEQGHVVVVALHPVEEVRVRDARRARGGGVRALDAPRLPHGDVVDAETLLTDPDPQLVLAHVPVEPAADVEPRELRRVVAGHGEEDPRLGGVEGQEHRPRGIVEEQVAELVVPPLVLAPLHRQVGDAVARLHLLLPPQRRAGPRHDVAQRRGLPRGS